MRNYQSPEIKNLADGSGKNSTMGFPAVSPVFILAGNYFVAVNRTYVYNTSPSGGDECKPYEGCEYGRFV